MATIAWQAVRLSRPAAAPDASAARVARSRNRPLDAAFGIAMGTAFGSAGALLNGYLDFPPLHWQVAACSAALAAAAVTAARWQYAPERPQAAALLALAAAVLAGCVSLVAA